MGGPAWLSDIFAAASLAVAVYCAARLAASRRWRRPTELDTDGAHVVMGMAMAGMLVSGLRTFPSTVWEIVFAAGAAWFGYGLLAARRGAPATPWRSAHPLPHLIECGAMVFMFAVVPASVAVKAVSAGGMGGMTMTATESRLSFLSLILALYLFGYAVWLGDRITLRATAPALVPAAALATVPALTTASTTPSPGLAGDRATLPAAPTGDRASSPATSAPTAGTSAAGSPVGRFLAPRCAVICKMTMGITMGYMLILML
jgi:hypothetical protein